MKSALVSLSLSAFFLTRVAMAHGDHDHPPPPKVAECKAECTKEEVTAGVSKKIIPLLVEGGKLEASWKDAKAESTEKKTFKQAMEWVVTFKNDKVTDKAKQTLYFFVSLDGTLTGVNHSGK